MALHKGPERGPKSFFRRHGERAVSALAGTGMKEEGV